MARRDPGLIFFQKINFKTPFIIGTFSNKLATNIIEMPVFMRFNFKKELNRKFQIYEVFPYFTMILNITKYNKMVLLATK